MKRITTFFINICLILSLALGAFAVSVADPAGGGAVYAASGKPEYIAHRGWSSRAPENSLAALKLAAKNHKFYGIEFDVWESTKEPKSKDPLLLVMHDENIKRICGVSKNIHDITRASLKKYTIKSGSNIKKYKGQRIPTADQAIETILTNTRGAIPVIELKERLSKRALRYLLKSLNGREAVIISFDFDAVADAVRQAKKMGISDNISTMYLSNNLRSNKYAATIRRMKAAHIDTISLKYPLVSSKTVKKFHKAKLKVGVWTVPNKKTARKYAKMGVDYITANGIVY